MASIAQQWKQFNQPLLRYLCNLLCFTPGENAACFAPVPGFMPPLDAIPQRAQLAVQYSGEDTGQIRLRMIRVQVAGIKADRLLDVLVQCGAGVFLIVLLHLGLGFIGQPDRVPVFSFCHAQNPPFFTIASAETLQRWGFSAFLVRQALSSDPSPKKSVCRLA